MATKALARNNYVQASAITWDQSDVLETPNGIHDAIPLLADKTTGRLLVDIGSSVALDNLNVNTDQIEGKQDTTNAILTTQAADTALIKGYTQVTKGSGVVDSNTQRVTLATDGPGVSNLSTIASNTSPLSGVTQTSASGKVGLDVNIIAGGGGGGGGASAAYNATLPTYTSGASTVLQTDQNGRLITTGPLTDSQLRASAVPVSASSLPLPTGAATSENQAAANTSLANLDADIGNVADAVATSDTGSFSLIALTKRLLGKFSALTDGTQKSQIVNGANTLAIDSAGALTVNNAPSQVYNYTATGAVAVNTVLIGPIECSQIREITVHAVAVGSGGHFLGSMSNDGTNWVTIPYVNLANGTIAVNAIATAGTLVAFNTSAARFFRLTASGAQTSGTMTIIAYASQQAPPKLYQSVTVSGWGPGIVGQTQVNYGASVSGSSLYHSLVSAASTNATSVKTSIGVIATLVVANTTASLKWLRIFNKASAPTVGTDTPVLSYPIQPNSTLDISCGAGIRLTTGIAYAITGGTASAAVTDSTAVGAGDVTVNLTYV